ncbi:MAG: hypothetical protein CVU80_01430 [Elusimicrobia bacterium HGW-Elusimicrobia-4]|nr:MAG: hypothetical protein CVU80_01430 [Elusimicrobia bacterium HGW-Elusimicrobia-4]
MDHSPERINKERHDVTIYLHDCKIDGAIYLPPGGRLSDFINVPMKQFIPVTNAVISAIKSGEDWKYEVEFLNLNKNSIITIFPISAMKEKK